jgi:hypothetical protein
LACGESSPASALTVRSRYAPSRRSHHRSDTHMMPPGRHRCCPADVHSGTETRTPPIGDFPTREAFLGRVSGAGFSGSRGSAISADPLGLHRTRSIVCAWRVPWPRNLRPARTPETSPRNQPQKRSWEGTACQFEQQSNRSARLARPLHTAVSRAIMCLSAVLTRGRGIACRDSLGDESSETRSGRSE